jgi:hypothetical protein
VRKRKFIVRRGARRNPNEILREPRFVESAQHRRETFGPLRMACVAGVVPQIEVVEQESGRSRCGGSRSS